MDVLTKDEFLGLGQELKCEDVPVPELKKGGVVIFIVYIHHKDSIFSLVRIAYLKK